jgi:Tfp pilus assembly protein PilF
MLYSIANEAPRALRSTRPEVPEPVESLVLRMLEKDPAARLSADETARELSLLTGAAPSRPEPTPARRRSARSWALTFGALLVVLALIPGMLRMRGKSRFREAVVLNNEGHDSLTAGNLDAARKRFEAALERAPKYAESKLNLAVVFHREGDENRAAGLFGQVIAENPARHDWLAAAHYGMGEIDLQAEAWPSAVLHLTEAVRLDSTRVEYPNNLGFALAQSGRTDQALATLRAAQARFPGEATLTKNVALSWLKAGQFDSALVAANEAVRLRPDYPDAWLIKERSEAALGDHVAARASLQTLRSLAAEPAMIAEAEAALREEPLPQTN